MKLEEIVTSLELSKRLSELGVKQESLFYWVISITDKIFLVSEKNQNYISQSGICSYEFGPHHIPIKYFYSAFTASELIELLPQNIIDPEYNETVFLLIDFYNSIKRVMYAHEESESYPFIEVKGKSLSDCLAEMLIHLIENNLLDPKKE